MAMAERYPAKQVRRQPCIQCMEARISSRRIQRSVWARLPFARGAIRAGFYDFSRAINLPGPIVAGNSSGASELGAHLEAEPDRIRQENKPAWLAIRFRTRA